MKTLTIFKKYSMPWIPLCIGCLLTALLSNIVEPIQAAEKKAEKPDAAGAPVCDPETGVCNLPDQKSPGKAQSAGKKNTPESGYDKVVPLDFRLFDAYGRDVRSSDYHGVPVLISTGACWCGGCQGHAEDLRLLEEKYHVRGLQVIRSVTYDNDLPAWEFQKHYRLPYVQLLDPSRQFESRYNNDGWPFIMLADSEGKVVFRKNNADWAELTKLLESMLPEKSPVRTIESRWHFLHAGYAETLRRNRKTPPIRPLSIAGLRR